MKRHLSDDRLIELCVQGANGGGLDAHLTACAECRSRHAELSGLLNEVADVSTAEADAAFPAERLSRQQARILQRIEQDGRPGRLITFPISRQPESLPARSRPASRWVAVAAVAGLVVGLLTGQLFPTTRTMAQPTRIVSNESDSGVALRVVSTTLSDDEFLGQVEAAGSAGPAALRPLDALTPRAWEVAR
jgi:hypothetical protein